MQPARGLVDLIARDPALFGSQRFERFNVPRGVRVRMMNPSCGLLKTQKTSKFLQVMTVITIPMTRLKSPPSDNEASGVPIVTSYETCHDAIRLSATHAVFDALP